jgi:SfnB family sulfur acquisition oxidoreductase
MNRAGLSELSTTITITGEADPLPEELSPSTPASRSGQARAIVDDADAIATAERLAAKMARDAADRDRNRRLPYDEMKLFAEGGLLGASIPKRWGGPEVSITTLGTIMRTIAAADPNIAQIPKNHFLAIDIMLLNGADAQKKVLFDEILNGALIGHAASERGTKNVLEIKTRLTKNGAGLKLNGEKFYTTGALYCDWIAVSAIDDAGRYVLAFVPRHQQGVTIIDDWSGFGQRTTASGTGKFNDVLVDPERVVSLEDAYVKPTLAGPVSQYLHACIDAGIAGAAINEAMQFVNTKSRPWADSGVSRACEDPYIISAVGDLKIRLFAAEASLEKAGRRLDEIAAAVPSEDDVAVASVNVAIVKVLTTELAILATNKMFELSGASATLATYNLDRHWRNARTHTLHDPVRWKYNVVGDFYLNCVNPRRHNYV